MSHSLWVHQISGVSETLAAIEHGYRRICLTCGHVGCCDSSPNRHARKHAHRLAAIAARIPGRKPMDPSRDVVFGHEFCCEIIDHGPGTQKRFKAGTRGSYKVLAPAGDEGPSVVLGPPTVFDKSNIDNFNF